MPSRSYATGRACEAYEPPDGRSSPRDRRIATAGIEWGAARWGSAVGDSHDALSNDPAAGGTRTEDEYPGMDECGEETSPYIGRPPTAGVAKASAEEG